MIDARLKESFDKLNPSKETREAMLRTIIMQEQVTREREESVKQANKRLREYIKIVK